MSLYYPIQIDDLSQDICFRHDNRFQDNCQNRSCCDYARHCNCQWAHRVKAFFELFAIALWTLGVVIVSLLVSRLHYKEWLPTIGINTIIILIYLRLLLGL